MIGSWTLHHNQAKSKKAKGEFRQSKYWGYGIALCGRAATSSKALLRFIYGKIRTQNDDRTAAQTTEICANWNSFWPTRTPTFCLFRSKGGSWRNCLRNSPAGDWFSARPADLELSTYSQINCLDQVCWSAISSPFSRCVWCAINGRRPGQHPSPGQRRCKRTVESSICKRSSAADGWLVGTRHWEPLL